MRRPLPWIVVLVLLLGAGIPRAEAHAVLMSANPAANQQLAESPKELELQFNENVGPVFFRVLDGAGKEVGAPGDIRLDGNGMFLPLGDTLTDGTYVISYRVISADTHPVGGSFAFAIGGPVAAGASHVAASTSSAWVLPTVLNRVLLYSSVLIAVGSALLLLLLEWPGTSGGRVRRQGRLFAIVAAVSFVLAIAFGGADILAAGAGALFTPATWVAGVKSTLGVSALIGIAGALLAVRAFRRGDSHGLLWTSAALLVASFLVTGHAATAAPVWLAATSVGLHLAGAGFWFAAFAPLSAASRSLDAPEAGRLMDRFSSRAMRLIGALLVSGVILTWIQVRTPANLLTTDYGRRLTWKLAFVAALLVFAAFNKWRLTPKLLRGEANAGRSMARSIRIETLLMVLIVAIAASLTLPTPPRALADQAKAGAAQAMTGAATDGFKGTWTAQGYAVDVEVTPARTGENMIMVRFRDAAGAPVTMTSATLDLSLPAASLEGISSNGQAMPPDMFHFMVSEMIIPGEWRIRVNGFVDDFTKIEFEGTVPVR